MVVGPGLLEQLDVHVLEGDVGHHADAQRHDFIPGTRRMLRSHVVDVGVGNRQQLLDELRLGGEQIPGSVEDVVRGRRLTGRRLVAVLVHELEDAADDPLLQLAKLAWVQLQQADAEVVLRWGRRLGGRRGREPPELFANPLPDCSHGFTSRELVVGTVEGTRVESRKTGQIIAIIHKNVNVMFGFCSH